MAERPRATREAGHPQVPALTESGVVNCGEGNGAEDSPGIFPLA